MTFPNVGEGVEQCGYFYILPAGARAGVATPEDNEAPSPLLLCRSPTPKSTLPLTPAPEVVCMTLHYSIVHNSKKQAGTTQTWVHACKQRKVLTLLPAPKLVFLDVHDY